MLRRGTAYVTKHYGTELIAGVFLVAATILPASVLALSVADVFGVFAHAASANTPNDHLATMAVLTPEQTFIAKDPAFATTEVSTTDSSDSLSPVIGPGGTSADIIQEDTAGTISLHHVEPGETINQIAKMYGVRPATIRLANDIPLNGSIHPGDDLLIFPIDGPAYKVQKGDTLQSIAKKFGGKDISDSDLQSEISDIALYNDLETTASLTVGTILIIPGADQNETAPATTTHSTASKTKSSSTSKSTSAGEPKGGLHYFKREWGGVVTQGFHDKYRAVDYGMPLGSKVGAAASGTVIAAKSPAGWNGGYGGVVIISHDNSTQTLYAHLSQLKVSVGEHVTQGQTIGLSGSTGRSTGPHMHFEIRNWHHDIPSFMM